MPGPPPGQGQKPPIDIREPLLLVGTCNAWGKDMDDTQKRFRFQLESTDKAESQVRLQLDLAGKTLSFQIISAGRTWNWRLCPSESSRSERTLQRGCWCDAELFLDPNDEAAHGRNFRISGENTVVVTVLRANGRARVRCKAVASEAPEEEESDEAFFNRMFNGEDVSSRRVDLVPAEGTPEVRVAAMLMLLPRAVRDCPGVFRTYLRYHLLAPQGPRLAHVFVFVDGEPDEASAALERWIAASPSELRSRVTLVDGNSSACLEGTSYSRSPATHSKARTREAASRGELSAKQVLNMERCLLLAKEQGIDWLICNLDMDEALVCSGSAGEVFAAAPPEVRQLQLLNHEAVPEEKDEGQAADPDFFRSCTLFKRNPYLLNEDAAVHMKFWSERAAAAAGAAAGDLNWDRGNRPLQLYFSGYCNGKSAVRVASIRHALPAGPHVWNVGPESTASASTRDACVLHYNNCEGPEGLLRKYTTRNGERWNELRLHQLCLNLQGPALAKLFKHGLLLTKRKSQVANKQLAAGVLLRIHSVRRALKELE